ncbi:MAG: hypothetical protein CFE21_17450 [Bacteroidetes bacterium B1(2017)]|nr:MAG: hypothetical protein CFE21_17450 [Bacteroidetes bacterium B1(2017)]
MRLYYFCLVLFFAYNLPHANGSLPKIGSIDTCVFPKLVGNFEQIPKPSHISNILNTKFPFNETGFKYSGFINITEIGASISVGKIKVNNFLISDTRSSLNIRTVNGYQFNYYFSMGVGCGLDIYDLFTLAPVTLDARIATTEGKFSGLLVLNAGYSFLINRAYRDLGNDGFIINPSVGFRNYLSENIALVATLGYKMQQQQIHEYYYYPISGSGFRKAICLNVGLSF